MVMFGNIGGSEEHGQHGTTELCVWVFRAAKIQKGLKRSMLKGKRETGGHLDRQQHHSLSSGVTADASAAATASECIYSLIRSVGPLMTGSES